MTAKKRKTDYAHEQTDEAIEKEKDTITKLYVVAFYLMRKKLNGFLKKFKEPDKQKRKELKDGKITKGDYTNWKLKTILFNADFNYLQNELAKVLTDFDIQALLSIKELLPDIFSLNMNYTMYGIEKIIHLNTSFSLCDKDTVNLLLRGNPKLLPDPVPESKLAKELLTNKRMKWNMQKINSVITQGIIQGQSINDIAKNLKSVTDMNTRQAITNARTMCNSAENAGRQEAYKRAVSMGIDLKQMWVATIDDRTRHEHRLLDGQVREIGEAFEVEGEKIRFPSDPQAKPHMVYNCRCTTVGLIKGAKINPSDLSSRRTKIPSNMTYEQWKHAKEDKK